MIKKSLRENTTIYEDFNASEAPGKSKKLTSATQASENTFNVKDSVTIVTFH